MTSKSDIFGEFAPVEISAGKALLQQVVDETSIAFRLIDVKTEDFLTIIFAPADILPEIKESFIAGQEKDFLDQTGLGDTTVKRQEIISVEALILLNALARST